MHHFMMCAGRRLEIAVCQGHGAHHSYWLCQQQEDKTKMREAFTHYTNTRFIVDKVRQ